MASSGSPAERGAVEAFLDEFLADLTRGKVRPLEDYVARAPEHAEAIRAEYEPLVANAAAFRRSDSTLAADAGSGTSFHLRFAHTKAEHAPAGGVLPEALQKVAHYRIEEEIGRGGMGVVYRASDQRLGRTVALKVLAVPLRHDTYELLLRFRREAEAASRLDHPGICPVYEAGTDEGVSWIAMRWLDGLPLSRVLTQSRSAGGGAVQVDLESVTQASSRTENGAATTRVETGLRQGLLSAMRLIEKTALALHAAHEAGVVHRDVKPANIMVTRSGEPVLLDFGVARLDSADELALTRQGDRVGTPAYMSPEQLLGDPQAVDRRCDVWALGVTLYELITLQQPFAGATREQLSRAILESEPVDPRRLNRQVPRDLALVTLTALQKDPARRYRTAQELADDLRRIRTHEPIQARPVPWPVRCLRWTQRHRATATALAAVFVLLAAGLATSLWNLQREQAHAAELQRTVTRLEELADTRSVRLLRARADTGWRAVPEELNGLEGMRPWLDEARRLIGRRGLHQQALEELRHGSGDNEVSAWRGEALQGLLTGLDALTTDRARVEQLASFTAEIEERTLRIPAILWTSVRERMQRNPRYHGVAPLEPQLGLVPLGPDSLSGLEEFAHLQSGSIPQRGADGALQLNESSCIVLVLLGVSDFVMGAEAVARDDAIPGANIDAMAQRSEGPAHQVRLAPYFIGKHEITQAQWMRARGTNPSMHHPGVADRSHYHPTLLHPVENVTHAEALRTLILWSLALPTEAQWENAARGRADSRNASAWWCEARNSLAAAANLADLTLSENGGPPMDYEPWHDGYVVHAPVSLRAANGFGLHDMLGNVWEWCADRMASYTLAVEAESGLRAVAADAAPVSGAIYPGWVIRGGGFLSTAERARCTARDYRAADQRDKLVGLRAARVVTH